MCYRCVTGVSLGVGPPQSTVTCVSVAVSVYCEDNIS